MTSDSAAPAGETLCWRAHPAAERMGRAVAASIAVLAASAGAATLMEGPFWGVVGLVLLVLALNRFFFPSRFVIDEVGITARYPFRTVRLRWDETRRFLHDEHGGYLSRRVRPSRMDAFAGMHLLFGADREAVIRAITQHLEGRRRA